MIHFLIFILPSFLSAGKDTNVTCLCSDFVGENRDGTAVKYLNPMPVWKFGLKMKQIWRYIWSLNGIFPGLGGADCLLSKLIDSLILSLFAGQPVRQRGWKRGHGGVSEASRGPETARARWDGWRGSLVVLRRFNWGINHGWPSLFFSSYTYITRLLIPIFSCPLRQPCKNELCWMKLQTERNLVMAPAYETSLMSLSVISFYHAFS